MKKILLATLLAAAALVTGCARPIIITPDTAQLVVGPAVQPVKRNVGYYISPADRDKTVITPGGGGDKVSYKPYGNLESSLQKVLSNTFEQVLVMPAPNDEKFIKANNIAYVFVPEITTTSLSTSLITWPPTDFTVAISCRATDPAGAEVWKTRVEGRGVASFTEFVGNYALAAHRAAVDAFKKLQHEILEAPEFKR